MIEVNDIVRTKVLDYSKLPVPTDKEEKKKHEDLIKKLSSLSDKVFRVVSKHPVGEDEYIIVENADEKAIRIGENDHSITFKSDEVEVLESDYLNNCCLEKLRSSTITDDLVCETCGFNINLLLSQYKSTAKSKQVKATGK